MILWLRYRLAPVSLVVTNVRVIASQFTNEMTFHAGNLSLVVGFKQDLLAQREIRELLSGEVFADKVSVPASEITDGMPGISDVHTDIDLAVREGDLVDHVLEEGHVNPLFGQKDRVVTGTQKSGTTK